MELRKTEKYWKKMRLAEILLDQLSNSHLAPSQVIGNMDVK